MREVEEIHKNGSRIHAASMFARALIHEAQRGMRQNDGIRIKIEEELQRRGVDFKSEEVRKGWEFFDKKLLRFRPRLFGAIGAYAMLTDQTYSEVVAQGGMRAFKALWALAAIQDDLIDDLSRRELSKACEQERKNLLRNAIFGKDKEFYRAAYRVIIDDKR